MDKLYLYGNHSQILNYCPKYIILFENYPSMSDQSSALAHATSTSSQQSFQPETQVLHDWKLVDLPQLALLSGEQTQTVVYAVQGKLYRWCGQWKQRGQGIMKFLKDEETGKIRLLMRRDRTLQCIANHYLRAKDIFCKLQQLKTSAWAWTWGALDCAEQTRVDKICMKFTTEEEFLQFRRQFEKACEHNHSIM